MSGRLSVRKSFFNYIGDIVSLAKTYNCIDAVDLLKKLPAFSFRQTARNNHFFYVTTELAIHSPSYCFERFGFGRGDKTAGIDDNNVGIIRLGGYHKTCLGDFRRFATAVEPYLSDQAKTPS